MVSGTKNEVVNKANVNSYIYKRKKENGQPMGGMGGRNVPRASLLNCRFFK